MIPFIDKLTYGPIWNGSFAFHLHLSGEEIQLDTDEEKAKFIDVLMTIRKYKTTPTKVIHISGKYTDANEKVYTTILKTLKSAGFYTRVEIDGCVYYPWVDYGKPDSNIDWLVVRLTDNGWHSFPCSELIYELSPERLIEPMLPSTNAFLLLDIGKGLRQEDLYQFITKSKRTWCILPKVPLKYTKDINIS